MKFVFCVLISALAGFQAWSQEIVNLVKTPDQKDVSLVLEHNGLQYSYKDPDRIITTWILAFEATRVRRHINFTSGEPGPEAGRQQLDMSSRVGKALCKYLQSRPWSGETGISKNHCQISYNTFFDLIEPKLRQEFNSLDQSPSEITKLGRKVQTFKEKLSRGNHPVADLSRSLEFAWNPRSGTRTPYFLELDSHAR